MTPRRRASDKDGLAEGEVEDLRRLLEESRLSREWHQQLRGGEREDETSATRSDSRSIGIRLGRVLNLHIRTKQALTATTVAGAILTAAVYVWPNVFTIHPGKLKSRTPSAAEIGSSAWVEGVDGHVKKGEAAFGRLEAVESQVGTLRTEQSSMRVELIDMRIDSLEQWEWQAEREGDPSRRDELRRKITSLRRKLADTAAAIRR